MTGTRADLLLAKVAECTVTDGRTGVRTRLVRAKLAAMTSHVDKAIARFEDLLPEYHRIFGASSPDTEPAQGNLRHWRTFRNGEAHR